MKFRRQFPIGPYFADFVCLEANLVVELDGESHEGREEYDDRRTKYLESCGFQVFRVMNDDVLEDVEAVAIGIAREAGIDVVTWLSGKTIIPIEQEDTPTTET